jgi:hypothetical protein
LPVFFHFKGTDDSPEGKAQAAMAQTRLTAMPGVRMQPIAPLEADKTFFWG